MAGVLRQFPNGMGGIIVCYSVPTSVREANEWLKRIGADKQGFKFNSRNNNKVKELRQFGKLRLRVELVNSDSIIPICQIVSKKYNFKIDWYNPVNWTERFRYPEDIKVKFK